jgi:hypothetical protein
MYTPDNFMTRMYRDARPTKYKLRRIFTPNKKNVVGKGGYKVNNAKLCRTGRKCVEGFRDVAPPILNFGAS